MADIQEMKELQGGIRRICWLAIEDKTEGVPQMMERIVVPRTELRKWVREAGLDNKEALEHVEYEVRIRQSTLKYKYPRADKLWDRSWDKAKDSN